MNAENVSPSRTRDTKAVDSVPRFGFVDGIAYRKSGGQYPADLGSGYNFLGVATYTLTDLAGLAC
jgi:hypothetical protein